MSSINTGIRRDNDIGVFNIEAISVERPSGKIVDNMLYGRSKHGLLYINDGEVSFRTDDNKTIRSGTGTLTLIPKGCHYLMRFEAKLTSFILLNFDMLYANGAPAQLADTITVLYDDISDYRIADTMSKIEECTTADDAVSAFRQKVLFYHLFSMIFDNADIPDSVSPKFVNIIPGVRMLQRTYLTNVPISDLAALCNISVSSFRALFTEQFGMSPIQYRNTLRIKRAKSLLSDGSYTVAEVAQYMGFDDTAYFCRFYKKLTGETPKQTQQKNK